MGEVESRRLREEHSQKTIDRYILKAKCGSSKQSETTHWVCLEDKLIMELKEAAGILELKVPYDKLPEDMQELFNELKGFGYKIEHKYF